MVYDVRRGKTAVLVIDVQKEYFDAECTLYTPNAETVKENILHIVRAAKANGVKCFFIQHLFYSDGSNLGRMGDFDSMPVFMEGTKGVEFIPEISPGETDVVIRKSRYNCFAGTELRETLDRAGIDTVIITGLMTNYCCLSTAYYAHDMDYRTIYVLDAVSGPELPDVGYGEISQELVKKVVAATLSGGIADVVSTEDIIAQISGFSQEVKKYEHRK